MRLPPKLVKVPVMSKLIRLAQGDWGSSRMVWLTALIFAAIAAVLAVLIASVVTTMERSANINDDSRALRTGSAAVASLQKRMSATLRDNAIWDDAYANTSNHDASWAVENWGKTSAEYELYDVAAVVAADGSTLMAYRKGAPFEPEVFFRTGFGELVSQARLSPLDPVVAFAETTDGFAVIGASAIQPYSKEIAAPDKFSVLLFAKIITPQALNEIASLHDLNRLVIDRAAKRDQIAVSLPGHNGIPVAFLSWPSRNVGATIHESVHIHLVGAAIILVVFLLAILVVGDIASRKLTRAAEKARYEATHDSLSGLLNRKGLISRMNSLLTKEIDDTITLLLVDLDGFKEVNDAWGHCIGDVVIQRSAELLEKNAPEGSVVARLGGDEFAVICSQGRANTVAEAISASFCKPFDIDNRIIEIGASIGYAVSNNVSDPHELLRRSDVALYRAKETGRGRAIEYTSELDVDRMRLGTMEKQLRLSLAQGEVFPVYQPLFDAQSRELRGVEALARWNSPMGRISPEVFIPLAERAGLIDNLGFHILATAIDQIKLMHPVSLSVNVSPVQLKNPNFAPGVISLLEQKAFEPGRLTLEVTEGVLISNPDQARRAINALKSIGVKFALDDFGCGYASIGTLRQFGFDRLKIDRSLVKALDNEDQNGEVLKATVCLANALKIPVTAEGIETERQARTLAAFGCDKLQGYLLGKPMSAEELASQAKTDNPLLDSHRLANAS